MGMLASGQRPAGRTARSVSRNRPELSRPWKPILGVDVIDTTLSWLQASELADGKGSSRRRAPAAPRKPISEPIEHAVPVSAEPRVNRGEREEPDALGAEPLGRPARQWDHTREGEHVGGQDPLDRTQRRRFRRVQGSRNRVRRRPPRHSLSPTAASPACPTVAFLASALLPGSSDLLARVEGSCGTHHPTGRVQADSAHTFSGRFRCRTSTYAYPSSCRTNPRSRPKLRVTL
jgi:hypothetical protein